MALKRSRRGLQLWFRPRRDLTPQSGVMAVQSSGSPAETISGQFRDNFGTPFRESREFVPFECLLRGKAQSIL
jgi:hypothetical protein